MASDANRMECGCKTKLDMILAFCGRSWPRFLPGLWLPECAKRAWPGFGGKKSKGVAEELLPLMLHLPPHSTMALKPGLTTLKRKMPSRPGKARSIFYRLRPALAGR